MLKLLDGFVCFCEVSLHSFILSIVHTGLTHVFANEANGIIRFVALLIESYQGLAQRINDSTSFQISTELFTLCFQLWRKILGIHLELKTKTTYWRHSSLMIPKIQLLKKYQEKYKFSIRIYWFIKQNCQGYVVYIYKWNSFAGKHGFDLFAIGYIEETSLLQWYFGVRKWHGTWSSAECL